MNNGSATTKEDMNDLHQLLAKEFRNMLVNGVKARDDEGNVVTLTPSSAQLNVIRQFLKDNDIQAAMTSKHMKGIVDNLPFGDEDLPPNVARISNQ